MGKHGVVSANRVQLPYWEYLSGETHTNPSNQAITLPSEATIVTIDSEDGKCYYAINGAFAQANSPGYVPADGGRILGPLGNLVLLHIHGPSAIVHLQFFKEV